MGRTLVIGDIHGGLKGLKQVLDRAKISENDHLIFLGDYVDGWSQSKKTVDFLIALSRKRNCTLIRGNHDDLAYQWLSGGEMNEKWLQHGGRGTIQSYTGITEAERKIHLEFYENLIDYHIDTKNRLFVHAGFQNLHGPEYEWHPTAYYWDRTLWEMVVAMDTSISKNHSRYPERLTNHKEIYIGHTPVTRIGEDKPTQRANVWNIDTGAAFKGPVSIIDVDTKEFWQSDPVWKLYPDEDGRNG